MARNDFQDKQLDAIKDAIESGRSGDVKELLQSVSIDKLKRQDPKDGVTLLHLAVETGNKELVSPFIDKAGKDVNELLSIRDRISGRGRTPVDIAMGSRDQSIANMFKQAARMQYELDATAAALKEGMKGKPNKGELGEPGTLGPFVEKNRIAGRGE